MSVEGHEGGSTVPPQMIRVAVQGEAEPRVYHEPLDDDNPTRYQWWFIKDGVFMVSVSRVTRRLVCLPLVSLDWYEEGT